MGYIYDRYIGNKITYLLILNNEMSSNKLRLAIREYAGHFRERMRRNRRETDRNKYYTPSQAKISATIKKLLEWQWLQRREEQVGGLKRVFYSLTEKAKFCESKAMNPEDYYKLSDAYQKILRDASLCVFITARFESLKGDTLLTGEPLLEYTYYQINHYLFEKFSHKKFLGWEIERAFTGALKDGVLEKRLINNEFRYVINDGLKEFVYDCWNGLYQSTLYTVKNIIILKKTPKNKTEYKKLNEWIVKINGEKYALDFFRDCSTERKRYANKKDKEKLLEFIKAQIETLSKMKEWRIEAYEKNNDSETAEKFRNVRESILYYISPPYVIEAVQNILAGTTTKHKATRKSKLYNPQDDSESLADILEMEREYTREDIKKQRLIESVNDIINATKVK